MTTLLGISPDGMCLRHHPYIRILMPDEEDEGKNSFLAATGATLWHSCPICTSENRARNLHPRAKSYANVVKQVKQLQATPEFQAFIGGPCQMPNHVDYQGEDQLQQQGAVVNGGDADDEAEAYRIQRKSMRGQGESKHDSQSPQGDDDMELPPPPPPSDEGYEDSDDQMLQFHDAAEELASPPPPPPPPPLSSKQQPKAVATKAQTVNRPRCSQTTTTQTTSNGTIQYTQTIATSTLFLSNAGT